MDYTSLLLIAADFLLHMSLVDARSCFFPGEGEKKFYICTKNEYCCSYGCCLSPSFQFYQLWYYWLMVIFMFLLCSGGGWWYRYWLHERYPPELSNSLHPHQVGRPCPRPYRPARITYHPARETIILHHVWKGPEHVGGGGARVRSPPPYQESDGSRMAMAMGSGSGLGGIVSNGVPVTSPYHQIYGPPPSYDSVVAADGMGVVAGDEGSAAASGQQFAHSGHPIDFATDIPQLHNSVSRILSGLASKAGAAPHFHVAPSSPHLTQSGSSNSSQFPGSQRLGSVPDGTASREEDPSTSNLTATNCRSVENLVTKSVCDVESPFPSASDQSHSCSETNYHKKETSLNKTNRYFCDFSSSPKRISSCPLENSSLSSHSSTAAGQSSFKYEGPLDPSQSLPQENDIVSPNTSNTLRPRSSTSHSSIPTSSSEANHTTVSDLGATDPSRERNHEGSVPSSESRNTANNRETH